VAATQGILAAMSTEPDLAFASAFLRERFGHAAGPPTELTGGAWSRAYAYDRDDSRWVIRFSPHGDDLAKDRLACKYASVLLPIPEVVEMGPVGDIWYAIAPHVEGAFLEELDADAFRAAIPAVLDLVDAMRAADTSGFAGSGWWEADGRGRYETWRAFLLAVGTDDPAYRTHGWRRKLAADPAAERTFEDALAALTSVVDACPERRDLVHNDLLHRNVFVAPRGRIAAVIDWANSLYGDFLYDVALLTFWTPWYPSIDETELIKQARARLDPAERNVDERLRAYWLRIGAEHIAYRAYLGLERVDDMELICLRTAEFISSGGDA
jgi:aminoglycoside phosphotransferase (APT) family kinase protein